MDGDWFLKHWESITQQITLKISQPLLSQTHAEYYGGNFGPPARLEPWENRRACGHMEVVVGIISLRSVVFSGDALDTLWLWLT